MALQHWLDASADSPAVVLALAQDALGHLEFVADRSWPHGVSTVIEVRSSGGRALIVKSPADVAKFGDTSAATFREAGRLLRLLHDAEPSATVVDFADSCRVRFDTWVARARPGLLRLTEVDFVADQLDRVAEHPDPVAVPCHRDWQPRNWLTAEDGTVSVIDFGNARLGYWFQDFERMWWNEWREVPALGRAFLDGFGSTLDVDARSQLRASSALWLLTTIVWSDEVGDDAVGDHARRSLQDAMEGVPDPF